MRQPIALVIRNPVLAGSHPDPSLLRVGRDFYLATSTFEWYPGVRLHHSRDLVRWRAPGGALDSTRLLDLAGCPDSGGVWAPNLSYAGGLFHLVYSNVSTYAGGFTDCPNYLVAAESINGPWSDPVLLHMRGFDASLFHDGEESWLLNLVHDWRPGHSAGRGIEGPGLYRRGPWYYLLTADGGTGYQHQVTVARSRSLTGPYERDPRGPLITARRHPDLPLQKAGHGSLAETGTGQWYLAYLAARPSGPRGPCMLGRETALAPVTWTSGGWPRTPGGLPALDVPAPHLPAGTGDGPPEVSGTHPDGFDGFDEPALGPHWSTLRRPAAPDWLSLTQRSSHLRLRGGRSPRSMLGLSLVARRVTAARCAFEATVEYRPRTFQHLAGITAYYNTRNWLYLHLFSYAQGQAVLRAAACDRGAVPVDEPGQEPLRGTARLRLGLDIDGPILRFRYDTGTGWHPFGPPRDATVLSDE